MEVENQEEVLTDVVRTERREGIVKVLVEQFKYTCVSVRVWTGLIQT